jgi:RES domain-containing protein
MLIYRITRKQYANLDGTGGLLVAGRWHERGYPVLYFSESRSLALLECLVHFGDYNFLPSDLVIMTLKIPSSTLIIEVGNKLLKIGWENALADTRAIGVKFIKNKKGPILKVPTIIVPGEFNYVINPLHKGVANFKIIKTEAFILDSRIKVVPQ